MTPPSEIAHYRITAKLGEGGMGAVYSAIDTRLNRDVAIKMLPPAFADDAARMARFEREAQVLASLNHPNIAAIYGIEAGALVMELVPGADLQGPVPVDTAIAYAKQIAAGLEAAHEKGVVHRDLKPANIKVTPGGTVKLLDFGLAKATGENSAATAVSPTVSPTLSLAMTQAGMILGTAAYMSPEQARGKPVDRRTDIWAFGVVFYEMLTGEMLFGGGETVSDSLAAVITREPDWNNLPPSTPAHVRKLLQRCLRKDPKLRLQAIGDARLALDEPEETHVAVAPTAPARRAALPWAIAAVCALAAIGLGVSATGGRRSGQFALAPLLRFEAEAPVREAPVLALSPDGSRILSSVPAANGATQLALRSLDQSNFTPLPGTENAEDAVFSPDGEWIAFPAGGKLFKLRLRGGAPLALGDAPTPRGLAWGDDDFIVFVSGLRNPIQRVSASGGTPQPSTKLDASRHEVTHRFPYLLPGGKTVIYTASTRGGGYDDADLAATEMASGRTTVLHHGGYHPMFVSGRDGQGFLLFFQQGTLYALPMNPATLAVREPPTPVLQDVQSSSTGANARIALSRNGLLVYQTGSGLEPVVPAWFDAAGHSQPLKLAPGIYTAPRVSPDGKKVLYVAMTGATGDIWVYDLASGNASKLTFNGKALRAEWAPDGRHVFSGTPGSYVSLWVRADGSAPPRDLGPMSIRLGAFSPDRKHSIGGESPNRIAVIAWGDLASDDPGPGAAEFWPDSPGAKNNFSYSPDGKWIAYSSDESGSVQVYVTAASGSGAKWQISMNGGTWPEFSPKGGELFYATSAGLVAAAYTTQGDAFVRGAERPHPLDQRIKTISGPKNYSLAPDGKHLVALISASDQKAAPSKLTFLVNFPDELERRFALSAPK